MNQRTIAGVAIAARARNSRSLHGIVLILLAIAAPLRNNAVAQPCIGDCNDDGQVTINELILGVDIALGALSLAECPNLDNGQGTVTVDRLIAAVNSALCDCQPCPATSPTATPTPTPATGTETPGATTTPTPVVSTWNVDNYDIGSSDCETPIEQAVLHGLASQYTVRQFDGRVEIDDGHGGVFEGTADPDGTVHVPTTVSGSIGPCDYQVDVDASANLSQSPTTATYSAVVNLSGFCLGLSDCSLQITSRWTRVDGAP